MALTPEQENRILELTKESSWPTGGFPTQSAKHRWRATDAQERMREITAILVSGVPKKTAYEEPPYQTEREWALTRLYERDGQNFDSKSALAVDMSKFFPLVTPTTYWGPGEPRADFPLQPAPEQIYQPDAKDLRPQLGKFVCLVRESRSIGLASVRYDSALLPGGEFWDRDSQTNFTSYPLFVFAVHKTPNGQRLLAVDAAGCPHIVEGISLRTQDHFPRYPKTGYYYLTYGGGKPGVLPGELILPKGLRAGDYVELSQRHFGRLGNKDETLLTITHPNMVRLADDCMTALLH